ncbi:ClpB protein [Labilithrix luteola]|uniref:ClpB protein n=1 Tax=Labilithrix luteola TaxID=1391654 RepID=A0A0K1PRQ0_9BACT|nr:AAA family ATPase [Labilithrix luteola]AKU96205.1 ClpB protein [Labilithrix luteola]
MPAEQTIQLERYASDAKALVAAAQTLADERKHVQVEPIHLLARALDRDRGVAAVFKAAGAEPTDVVAEVEAQLGKLTKASTGLAYLSSAMLSLLTRAEKEAGAGTAVGVEHLLNALSQEIRGPAAVVLQAFALGPGSLRPHMAALKSVPREAPGTSAASAATGGDVLQKFAIDLVARAKEGAFDPVIGRDTDVRRLLQILERRQKNHPLLVGEPGVGKTAIVSALAMRIATADVPQNLANLAILELQVGQLLAGARLRGEVEDRLKAVFAAVQARDALLYISSLESLLGQSGSAVFDLLKPMLARGEVRMVASTTPEGLRKLNDKDASLLRQFTLLTIEPPTPEGAIEVLRGIATRFEKHHKVQIGDPAIVAAVRLAKRYVQEHALPDSAIDLLDEASARKRVEIDGLPAHMDDAIRRVASLKAQLSGLENDADAMSVKTRDRIQKEIAELEPTVAEMRVKLDSRRGALAAQTALREEMAKLQAQLEQARKEQNFAKLGELEHVQIPDVRRRLEAADAAVDKAGLKDSVSGIVTEEDVALVLGDWTGIPVAKMLEGESEKLLKMEERLTARVIGQTEAVKAVSKAVRRGRVGLRDPGKPIGSFLFLGPSGVGKTELAKALAEFLFDDEQSMTRLDMSEFMEKHMAQRLVGAPPGYVDSEEGGFLTEAVRRRPYSVLLFDEVEKAHSDVFNLLLQVLDDGRLTDGRGRTADFSNTVVIMTSNIGSQRILETDPKLFESEEGREALRDVLHEELRNFLRPEFLNRIDDVIVFRPLSKGDLRGIVDIQLRRLEKLMTDRELKLDLSEGAKMALVERGYEPAFGARPLKRAILKAVQDPLAEEILAGGYATGSTVHVDVDGDSFKFIKK